MNPSMYVASQKRKEQEEQKVERITKTDSADKVEVVNLYDAMMKNAGIDLNKLMEK